MTKLLQRILCMVLSALLLGCAGGTAGSGGVEVRGKITSEQDRPIEGALIEILSLENEPIAATSSDASGEFIFSDIPERAGEIRITLPTRAEAVVSTFSVPEGRDTAVVRVRDDSIEGPTARVEYPEEDEVPEDDNPEERPSPEDGDDDEDNDDDGEVVGPEEGGEEDDDGPVIEEEDEDSEDVDDDEGSEEPAMDDDEEAEQDDDSSTPSVSEDDENSRF